MISCDVKNCTKKSFTKKNIIHKKNGFYFCDKCFKKKILLTRRIRVANKRLDKMNIIKFNKSAKKYTIEVLLSMIENLHAEKINSVQTFFKKINKKGE